MVFYSFSIKFGRHLTHAECAKKCNYQEVPLRRAAGDVQSFVREMDELSSVDVHHALALKSVEHLCDRWLRDSECLN